MSLLFALPAAFAAALTHLAQNVPLAIVPLAIATDRPDFTESSLVVPVGSTQIESGLTLSRINGSDSSLTAPEVLIRQSLSNRLELRFGLPNYNWMRTGGSGLTQGFDDLYLGFKFQLAGESDSTQFALIPAVFLPAGRDGVRSPSSALDLKLVWARSLPNDKSLSGMIYWSNPQVDGLRAQNWQHTLSLGASVRSNVGVFFEHVLDVSASTQPAHLLHSGFTYQSNRKQQFDLHFGVGLTGKAVRNFVGIGYSVIF